MHPLVPMIHTDVLIVGKGMAGLVLSYLLQEQGVNHLLLDKQPYLAKTIWAETLPPSAIPLLRQLGLLGVFERNADRTYGYHSSWGSEQIISDDFFRHQPAKYGLRIQKARLLAEIEKGVIDNMLPFQYLVSVEQKAGNYLLEIVDNQQKPKTISAKLLVDASGRSRALLRMINIGSIEPDHLLAFSHHLPSRRHPALRYPTYIASFPAGWGIVSKFNTTTNVMTLFAKKNQNLSRFRDLDQWPSLLKAAPLLSYFFQPNDGDHFEDTNKKVSGSKANSSRAAQIAGNDCLAVGDAALAFDPVSSHGITNALYGASAAAAAISKRLSGKDPLALEAYAASLEQLFEEYLRARKQIYQRERRWLGGTFWAEEFSSVVR